MNNAWVYKVTKERKELRKKLSKLYLFMASEGYDKLGYTSVLLQDQRDAMEDYLVALDARLQEYNRDDMDRALEALDE